MEKISFQWVTFTAEQLNAILSMVSEGRQGNLKTIIIYSPDVQGTVCQELLQAARQVKGLLHFSEREEEDSEDGEEYLDVSDSEVSDAE